MKKCGVTWFIWVRADTGKTKSPYLLTETEAQVNSHILWFVSHTWISWGRIWNWSFIRVQTYTNISYKLKESENRSQITDRNEGSPKRKSPMSEEARNWICQTSWNTTCRIWSSRNGEHWCNQDESSVSLRTWSC